MLGDEAATSHWHDFEFQLDPHRLQVRESPRQGELLTAFPCLKLKMHPDKPA